ncbi:MAG: hypothetical protein HC850_04575 [Rhodomicrobium sp.]|nr:hypothetical protein [Rhodomicrobium sp.]
MVDEIDLPKVQTEKRGRLQPLIAIGAYKNDNERRYERRAKVIAAG